jgi:rubredoxin
MSEVRWGCFRCGKVYQTKEGAVRCHNAHVQPIEDVPNPPRIRWWAGR